MHCILLLALLGLQATGEGSSQAGTRSSPLDAWEHVHGWLEEQMVALSADLQEAHGALLARAREEDPKLVEILSPEPPTPRPWGYGILPEVAADQPLATVEPRERDYSLEILSTGFTGDFRDAAVLSGRAVGDPDLPLGPAVEEFVRLRKRMRSLEEHLSYHAWWQQAIVDSAEYFADRNRIVRLVREMEELRRRSGSPVRIAELHREIGERIAPFEPTEGLTIEERDGLLVLPVRVHTDIVSPDFLMAFREGVEAAFVDSPAARARGFAVELEILPVDPGELHPGGVPPRASPIDLERHVGRFPEGSLVLTTGAKSTHSWTGRSVLLGPDPLSRRTLAHEFGHLLGFNDGYLRGFDGSPRGRFGARMIEWSGLIDDLMGNPGAGRVTEEMIERLIGAYGGG